LLKISQARVLFVTDSYAGFGGTWTFYHDLVENLHSHLSHAELLCPPSKDSHQYITSMSFPMPGDKTQKVFFPNLRDVNEKIKNIRPHIVVISTPGPYGITGMVHALRLGIRMFVVFQTEFDKLTNIYWNRILYRLSKIYLDGIYKLYFRIGDNVIIPNPNLKKRIHRMGADNVDVLGTPIARDFLETPVFSPRKTIRSILYLGRLTQEKNVDAILHSAEQFQDINFVIAGGGPLNDKVIKKEKILNNLAFLGWVPRSSALSLIDQSDMLILPSKVESFGTVALEAMARGRLALVSHNCGIIRDSLLKKGLFQIEPGELLSDAINRVKTMDQNRLERTADLARKSSTKYNTKTITQWLDLFAQSL